MITNRIVRLPAILFFIFATSFLDFATAQTPEWIWHPDDGQSPTNSGVRYFRKTFTVEGRAKQAILSAAADDAAEAYLNGDHEMSVNSWSSATTADVRARLMQGENVIAVRGKNEAGNAGIVVRLEITYAGGRRETIVSDASWLASTAEDVLWNKLKPTTMSNWVAAASLGKLGMKPWGDSLRNATATAAESLTVLPGFKVRLLHSATVGEGSWICMTVDPKGRLIISPQKDDQPLLRVTLTRAGDVAKIEPLPAPVHQAMGLCYAHKSLYVSGHGPNGTGLYRLIDANHNDQFDTNEIHFLKKFGGEGEHGYHGVVAGPDGMIYVMNGNHTKVPEGISTNSPHRNYQEDFLLPRQWDANGHAVGILAPGGHILRTDPDGKKWELLLGGFRNSYDFDFNADGEMFAFDSDMEWDWGLPWYRPTRINHCVLGGESGWRSGSGKWPDYYPDSLPAVVNIGIGSPTGVKFGTKSNFPEKYRKALFAMDWSYGRILAVHLKPKGASYVGTFETFVRGKPLNVTDLEFGRDGAMYFITGGRGTQSGLYRVSYEGGSVGTRSTASHISSGKVGDAVERVPTRAEEKISRKARALRHKLESFHGKKNPRAVDFAWPHLNSDDRFIRYAARVAIESQDVAQWRDRALSETNTEAGLTALLALARCGGRDTQRDLLMALKKFPLDSLNEEQKLAKLRVVAVSFARQGRPEPELAKLAIEKLNRLYPATSERLNRELSQLLIYLGAPDVIAKTMDLFDKAATQEEQAHYIFCLRNAKSGWTLEQRQKYFNWFIRNRPGGTNDVAAATPQHPVELMQWFKDVDRDYNDGASYAKYLVNIRKDALATLTTDERTALGQLTKDNLDVAAWKATRERKFIKEWKVADLEADLDRVGSGRDFLEGKHAFNDVQCILCHRFGNEGGSIGPELTAVASKYARRDILQSLLEPSKVVSDQYQNYTVVKKDGEAETGRITDENDERIVIVPNPLAPESRVEIKKSDIAKRVPSKVSPMPEGLLNNLSHDEILDLLAYIESMGKASAKNFKK